MPRMRAADRKKQLLEVAAECFAASGFRGTTTAELAAAAGVTEPILYRHFASKLDLFLTLIDAVGRTVIDEWKDALAGVDDADERLRILLAANPATHARGRGVYRVIFQAMSEPDADRRIATRLRRHLTTLHRFIDEELTDLQRAGVVRPDEPSAALAWLLVHVAIGYGMAAPLIASAGSAARIDMQRLMADLLGR